MEEEGRRSRGMVEAMACKEEETSWVAFEDDEEALSLSDLPVVGEAEGEYCRAGVNSGEEGDAAAGAAKCSPEDESFEFRTCSGAGGLQLESAEAEMCVADEVFFQGQILPLRPSVSSDSGLFPASRGPSRCGSRSDSMDRSSSSATGSLGFESSRSMSGRSSSTISRSQSTHSSNSAASSCANDAPGRLSISNNFYAHPSPKPHVCSGRRKSTSSARMSTSSAGSGWGLLRLGLVKTPEIDLDGLRHRKPSAAAAAHNSATNRRVADDDSGRSEKKAPTQLGITRCSSSSGGGSSNTKFDARGINGSHKEEKPAEKKASWSLGNRLRCSCSPGDVVEATCSRIVVVAGGPETETARLAPSPSLRRRQEGTCHSRTFQWLAELPVPKPPVA